MITKLLGRLSPPPVVAERARPWRLQSQGYVAFLGGFAAVTTIALMNADRLDVSKRGRALIAGAGLLGLVLDVLILDVVMIWGTGMDLGVHTMLSILLVLTVHIVQMGVQRPYDRKILLLSRGPDHAPMWLAGAAAILVCGSVEHFMLTAIRG
ncbi:hypothetical protein SAMN05216276_109118 [Streptosporangium subroseum]|uniref:Uncharacterized protein n=1 Tax=Streptosporangium subroseum TaxID=106412 RepID=A0A239P6Z3_9ACTN|nr:hypothetical protein [Streptosporangium subroseum]SNT62464.1 hypothetical protein SAMN05216276_109118 [Streptosporangium subroseum]